MLPGLGVLFSFFLFFFFILPKSWISGSWAGLSRVVRPQGSVSRNKDLEEGSGPRSRPISRAGYPITYWTGMESDWPASTALVLYLLQFGGQVYTLVTVITLWSAIPTYNLLFLFEARTRQRREKRIQGRSSEIPLQSRIFMIRNKVL